MKKSDPFRPISGVVDTAKSTRKRINLIPRATRRGYGIDFFAHKPLLAGAIISNSYCMNHFILIRYNYFNKKN